MLRIIAILSALVLAAYLAYESAVSPRKYRRLKRAIADGDARARSRFYADILWFEWLSAFLAFAALQFDIARFDPAHLQIGDSAFGRWWISAWHRLGAGFLAGVAIGALISLAAILIGLRARHRATEPGQPRSASRWQNILPDFTALIPVTPRERVLFALVALSAGVCEEVAYRAWLLDVLHGAGFTGAMLVVIASTLFGVGHYYQGYAGIFITSLLGLAMCGLYVASGTLLVPIIVHALIDLRIAILPNEKR